MVEPNDTDDSLTALEDLRWRLAWHDEMGQMMQYVACFGWDQAVEKRLQDLRDLLGQQAGQQPDA